MKFMNPSHLICLVFNGLLFLSSAQAAPPTGAMGFLLDTSTTVTAGDAGSWIRPLWDWNGAEADTVATPNVSRQFTVTSSRDANDLIIRVIIADATQVKQPGRALELGDQIIIHIDPNNSRSAGLELRDGDAFNTDHRYVVRLNMARDGVNACEIRHDIPVVVNFGGESFLRWSRNSSFSACPRDRWNFDNNSNDVTIHIPLSDLGFETSRPVKDFGLAIAFINDLGVDSPGPGRSIQLTSSAFPLALPVSNDNNPVDKTVTEPFIDNSGVWSQPDKWGVGYITTAPLSSNNVVLNHPSDYYAEAIKLSNCNASDWNQIAAGGPDQRNLMNWYKYYPAEPCQMGIWIKATNKTADNIEGRLLILWADAGIGQRVWNVVKHSGNTATTPVVFAGGIDDTESITRQIWTNVRVGGSAFGSVNHPCLRVYILPKDLNATADGAIIDDSYILGIESDPGKIAVMERAYGYQPYPNNNQAAQMNFTNLASMNDHCSLSEQCNFDSFERFAILSTKDNALGNRNSIDTAKGNSKEKTDESLVRVNVTGFGIEPALPQQRYEFIEPIGAMGWVVPQRLVLDWSFKPVTFPVTNPPVLYRDFSGPTPKDISAPSRRIVLATQIKTDSGIPAKIEVLPIKEILAPGETITAKVRIEIAPEQLLSPDGLTRWQWMLLLSLLLILLLFFIIKRRSR